MPQEPKKRHSRQRQGKRRAAIKLSTPSFTDCLNCGAIIPQHTVCPKCGYYKGRVVIQIQKAKPKEEEKEGESTEEPKESVSETQDKE